MKKYISIIALLLYLSSAFAQTGKLRVLNSRGVVKDVNGNIIKKGTYINLTDKVIFATHSSLLILFDAEKEDTYALECKKGSELNSKYIVSQHILSTDRGMRDVEFISLDALHDFFALPVVVLGDSLNIAVNTATIPMTETRFFYLSYSYNDETINKRLPNEGKFFRLIKNEIFKIDGTLIKATETTEVELYYYDVEKGKSYQVAVTSLSFPDNEKLREKVKEIKKENKKASYEVIRKKIEIHLIENYGFPEQRNLKKWYNREFEKN